MGTTKSIINMHNKELTTEKKTEEVNCLNKPDCSFPTNDKLPIQYTKQKLHQIFETFMEEYIPETTIWKL